MLCSVFQVSRSAYYDWQHRKGSATDQKKKEIKQHIVDVFQEHRKRYGVRRIAAELKANGIQAGAYRVRKVLNEHNLQAIQLRSFVPKTTDSRHPYPISPNLLLKRETPAKPDEVWAGDITYIPLAGGGFLYLAVWMDLWERSSAGIWMTI